MSKKSESILYGILSRLPFFGDIPIACMTVVRTSHHVYNGQFKDAAAEVFSGVCQIIGDDIIPIVGRDVGHEIARFIVRKGLNSNCLEERSFFGRMLFRDDSFKNNPQHPGSTFHKQPSIRRDIP